MSEPSCFHESVCKRRGVRWQVMADGQNQDLGWKRVGKRNEDDESQTKWIGPAIAAGQSRKARLRFKSLFIEFR